MKNSLSKRILFTIFFLTIAFYSCEARGNNDFSRKTARENLKKGSIGFILEAELSSIPSLAKIDPSAPFYAGLLVGTSGDKLRSARLFETALQSPITKVKSESCRRLVPLLTELKTREQGERVLVLITKEKAPIKEFITLKAAALYVLGRYDEVLVLLNAFNEAKQNTGKSRQERDRKTELVFSPGAASNKALEELESWNNAFLLLSAVREGKPGLISIEEMRSFLLDSRVDAAYRWAYEELLSLPDHSLPNAERIAAAGRLAVSTRDYSEALLHFDRVRNSQLSLFFRHTPLLQDLGRSFISSGQERGFKLLTDWESAIRTGKNSPIGQGVSEAELREIRYNLLYYAGRIRRQQAKHSEAMDLFTQALALAPDEVQKDACIWYILSSAYTDKPETVPALVRQFSGMWHNDKNFYDILDKLSCYLVGQQKWGSLADVFSSIRSGNDGSIIARYAYLVGRAVSLGYISGRTMNANDYFTIAYEEGNASFYYRALSASYLGKTVIPLKGQSRNTGREYFPHGDELEFFIKFFEYGCSSYAMSYLRENENRYTGGELRVLAKTFASSEHYLESIQITGINMRREDYVMEKADLELYYPKPFTELIERHAKANGLLPSLYFGLIRTESAFSPAIASHAGAVGLAQIMPQTGREIAALIKKRGGPDFAAEGTIDLSNPEINVHMGAVYLKDLTNSMGSSMLALLAYNCGPVRVNRFRRALPGMPEDLFIETITIDETRNYGKQVIAAAAAYGYLYYGMSMHDVIRSIFK